MNLAYLAWLALSPTIKRASSQLSAETSSIPRVIFAQEEGTFTNTFFLSKARAGFQRHQRRRATALALHSLDDRTLADIGLERFEIDAVVFGKKLP